MHFGDPALEAAQHLLGLGAAAPVTALDKVVFHTAAMPGADINLPVLADAVDDLAEHLRHFLVVTDGESQRFELGFAPQRSRLSQQARADLRQQCHEAGAQPHRVSAGCDKAQPLLVDLLVEHRSCSDAVADMLMRLPKHLPQEHGADINLRLGQGDNAPGDHAAIVKQFEFRLILRDGTARRRTQRRRDRSDQRVNSALQRKLRRRLVDDFRSWHKALQSWFETKCYCALDNSGKLTTAAGRLRQGRPR